MDDIVRQAMAKWPNVPHCYGWLALDARGSWRMRDERAQALNLPGDRITNPALVGFINRNYLHDEQGSWYFQNGPQRVYVSLEATPYIARTEPAHGFVLHTGNALAAVDAAWLTDTGQLVLQHGQIVALLDDRDMAQCLARLHMDGAPVSDEQMLDWLAHPAQGPVLTLEYGGAQVPVQPVARDALAEKLGFVPAPRPVA